jgi:hypothetical protein
VRRATLLAAALTACAPAAPAPPPAHTPAGAASTAPADDLAPGAAARTSRRAWLARVGPIRFAEGGEVRSAGPGTAEGQRLPFPYELVVVAERPVAVRVVVESEGARLLLFVDRADLWPVPVAEAVLTAAPGVPGPAGTGVRLAPGFPIAQKARQAGARRVAGRSGALTFEGWLPESALGEVFDRRPWPPTDGDTLVREGAVLVAEPGGPELARFRGPDEGRPSTFAHAVVAEPGGPSGWQRLRYATPEIEVRGLVNAADCQPLGSGLGRLYAEGHGDGSGFQTDTRTGKLATGAPILAPGTEARIGVAVGPVRVFYADTPPDGAGRQAVTISAWPFGFLSVVVRGADVGPDEARR